MTLDEVFVTVVATVAGPILWVVWLSQMARFEIVRRRPGGVFALSLTLIACAFLIFMVLRVGASPDVTDSPAYMFMYVVGGLAWLRAAQVVFPYLGLSPRDDVFERRNEAAVFALIGALIGVTLCYAGGNVGHGPGWWVVMFSAGVATATLMMSWAILGQFTAIHDAITIDRDRAAGIRLGACLVACGLVLGRGVAGDWVSVSGTVLDLMTVLPGIVVILLLAVIVERLARPTPKRPHSPPFGYGALPAGLYLLIGIAAVWWKGWPA